MSHGPGVQAVDHLLASSNAAAKAAQSAPLIIDKTLSPLRARLSHVTHYAYDRDVLLGPHSVRLRPTPHGASRMESYLLEGQPEPTQMKWRQDVYGNYEARLEFAGRTRELRILVEMVLDLSPVNPFDFLLDTQQLTPPFSYRAEQRLALHPYLQHSEPLPALQDYLQRLGSAPRSMTDHVIRLNQLLHGDLIYRTRMEEGVQTPLQTLALGSGSCRDSGWLLVHLFRQSGLAARFVSGYLVHLRSDAASSESKPDDDSVGLHAWTEVFLPEAGWLGLDPSSGLLAGTDHIPLACTPEPMSAAPIDGLVEVSESTMAHHMSLTRLPS